MGAFLMGSALMVAGLFASFIPPFIWGAPLFIIGVLMIWKGIFSTTYSAAKATVAIGRELSRGSTQNDISSSHEEMPRYTSDPDRFASSSSYSYKLTPSEPAAPVADMAKAYDVEKWEALRKYDPVVKPIYESLLPYGQAAVDEFAKAYIAMNRPDLADSMAAQIIEDARAAKVREEERRAEALSRQTDEERERAANRVASAERFMKKVRENRMYFNGMRVVSMELYYGTDTSSHGMALIQFENGRREFRTETGWSIANEGD